MTKQVLLTVFVFVVALVSGVFIGRNMERPHPRDGGGDRSWLADELKLSPDQREKMRTIWQEMLWGSGPHHGDVRRQAAKERDDAIAALITPAQKPEYDKINDKFGKQMADMSRERDEAIKRAVEQTKAILDEKQKAKYEELLAKGMLGPRGPHPSSSSAPATQNVAQ